MNRYLVISSTELADGGLHVLLRCPCGEEETMYLSRRARQDVRQLCFCTHSGRDPSRFGVVERRVIEAMIGATGGANV